MENKEFCALFMSTPPIKGVKVLVKDQASTEWNEVPAKVLPMSRFEAKQSQMKEFIKNYLKYIYASKEGVIQIQKGLQDGLDYEQLFVMACECISDMRGDEQFRKQTRREIERRSHQ